MRILLVEDEVKLANAISRALKLQKYAVDVAYDGETGLDFALVEKFDLLILDLMLPKVDGLEICRQVRKAGIDTPILILTARGQITDRVTGLDVGADDYMIKPFSFEELFARIRALMRRPQKTNSSILCVKDLTLDRTAFKVQRSGQMINLSSKEFAILEYLLSHKNSIVSKDELVSHVWNYDAEVLPNVVEVHVKHLRDKISLKNSPEIIRTVRSVGYIVED